MTKTQSRRKLKQLTKYPENSVLWTRELAAIQNAAKDEMPLFVEQLPVLLFLFVRKVHGISPHTMSPFFLP